MIRVYAGIAVLVLWSVSLFLAYSTGARHATNELLAEQKRTQDRLIEEHKQKALEDMRAFVEAERKAATQQAQALKRKHALEMDIARKQKERQVIVKEVGVVREECALDEQS